MAVIIQPKICILAYQKATNLPSYTLSPCQICVLFNMNISDTNHVLDD